MPRFASIFALLATFLASPAFALPTVTVLADETLSFAISELSREYSKNTQTMINASFAAQLIQQQQINEGGEADILITTRQDWIDGLKMQGLVDVYSEKVVAQNRLALLAAASVPIAPRNDGIFPLNEMLKYFSWEPAFLVGNPDTLDEGKYTKEALRNLGIASDLEEYTLYPKSRTQMLEMIEQQGMIGVLFYSSIIGNKNLQLIDLLAESSHTPIRYTAVVIASDNMEEARKFMSFLGSDRAKEILRNNGFYTN